MNIISAKNFDARFARHYSTPLFHFSGEMTGGGGGALVVQLVESWVYNPEDTGLNPRAVGKKHHKYSSPPAHQSVKRVPGLVLGSKHCQKCNTFSGHLLFTYENEPQTYKLFT